MWYGVVSHNTNQSTNNVSSNYFKETVDMQPNRLLMQTKKTSQSRCHWSLVIIGCYSLKISSITDSLYEIKKVNVNIRKPANSIHFIQDQVTYEAYCWLRAGKIRVTEVPSWMISDGTVGGCKSIEQKVVTRWQTYLPKN